MKTIIFAHDAAHDDLDAAIDSALKFCSDRGLDRPTIHLADDSPLAPDLAGLQLTTNIGAVVVPSLSDLMWGAAAIVQVKQPKLGPREVSVASLVELHMLLNDLCARGVGVHIVDTNQTIPAHGLDKRSGIFSTLTVIATRWKDEDSQRRSIRSMEALEKARNTGVTIGRPRKRPAENEKS